MFLDLADERLRARLTLLSPDKARLTIDYPRAEPYRSNVLAAVANLLVRTADLNAAGERAVKDDES